MYTGYKAWDLKRELRLEQYHATNWKHPSRRRRNRPQCGARCRDGHECKAKAVVNPKTDKPINGRCRMHGGLSTGARTAEGKERCRQAAKDGMIKYWQKKKSVVTQQG